MLDDVIEDLKENGYINDDSYIERAVSEFVNLNNLSLKELKYKLMNKGLKKDLIEDYFYNHSEELEQYEINSAKNVILKKSNNSEEQEIIEYLLKKGYKIDLVRRAMEELEE